MSENIKIHAGISALEEQLSKVQCMLKVPVSSFMRKRLRDDEQQLKESIDCVRKMIKWKG